MLVYTSTHAMGIMSMWLQEPWEAVRSEMVDDKGLPGHVADKIGEFVVRILHSMLSCAVLGAVRNDAHCI